MFEKYWKPYFDIWSNNVGDALERILENPEVLKRGADGLGWIFKGKHLTDQALHKLITTAGISAYNEQKKALYALHRLEARTEDLQEDVQELRELLLQLRKELQTSGQKTSEPGTSSEEEESEVEVLSEEEPSLVLDADVEVSPSKKTTVQA